MGSVSLEVRRTRNSQMKTVWACDVRPRTGIIPGLKQCVMLRGVCKDGGCTSTDSTIGVCNDEKKCCRRWWVLLPYPTPVPRSKSP
ncbi:beta-defensin 130B-like [Sturnira hondurensis]|uniref:beta-defensin 130B-like n=1 Tax=Sturnira hondurensis TaxID=192404 RepID=UPI00187A97BB|nr:beta-defensin 130B-like [Sturnira hondurensis]